MPPPRSGQLVSDQEGLPSAPVPSKDSVLAADDLVLARGVEPVNFQVGPGLTILCNHRENYTTALAMTLAGRRRSVSGDVLLAAPRKGRKGHKGGGAAVAVSDGPGHLASASVRQRFSRVALAGVLEIDSLERQVPVREAIREQVAWVLPWYRLVPRDIMKHPAVTEWSELLGLTELDASEPAGALEVVPRFLVRVLLALITRPHADLLIVDDLDQLRDMSLRARALEVLTRVSSKLPVLVQTVNPERPSGCSFIEIKRVHSGHSASETEDD